ncbi:MAG: hypothetical protein H6815_01470 [Phycisphaeraceae bacterium]|nr:hypothetical protein [Phycisphaerales bacterium]MCB9859096.1 hypothetical protein [Phycisphaeraceae bacterium]
MAAVIRLALFLCSVLVLTACTRMHVEQGEVTLAHGESHEWTVDGLDVRFSVENEGDAWLAVYAAEQSHRLVAPKRSTSILLNHAVSAQTMTVRVENTDVAQSLHAKWKFRGPIGWSLR